MTAMDLIVRGLKLCQVASAGNAPTADEAKDGLKTLQSMVDSWAATRLTIWFTSRSIFPLVIGQQDYTIGTGGDFDVPRPVWIDRASIISYNNPLQPLELAFAHILDVQEWQSIPTKAVYSALPTAMYYDYNFPLGGLHFWPIPNNLPLSVGLYLPNALTGFSDFTTDYTFPPGYEEAILYNLAMRLYPEYGKTPDPIVAQMAVSSLALVKRANIRLVDLISDPALRNRSAGFYNFYNDQQI